MKTGSAEVSVVIPCYRCAATIERAVASVAAQTLRPAEIILVDDCSGDETWAVLKKLQEKYGYNWIKLIALPENSGPGSSRNAGWEIASQPYIAFLDADDAWHPQKIEIQYGWMCEHQEVSLSGHARRITINPDKQLVDGFFSGQAEFTQIGRGRMLLHNYFLTPSVMIKRDLPYRFDPDKRYCEDYLLWCEICLDGLRCYWNPLPLATLFKAPYGEAGLSADLWAMAEGGFDVYRRLFRTKRVHFVELFALYGWLIARYVRRVVKARLIAV